MAAPAQVHVLVPLGDVVQVVVVVIGTVVGGTKVVVGAGRVVAGTVVVGVVTGGAVVAVLPPGARVVGVVVVFDGGFVARAGEVVVVVGPDEFDGPFDDPDLDEPGDEPDEGGDVDVVTVAAPLDDPDVDEFEVVARFEAAVLASWATSSAVATPELTKIAWVSRRMLVSRLRRWSGVR